MTNEVIFAGFGGQGILFSGKVLAYTGLIDEREVSWLPSYGPEMRGGTANCSVCLSDKPIGSPLILEPSTLVVMNGPSYAKFIDTVQPNGKVFIDSTLISDKCERSDISCYYIPCTELALSNDMNGMANMIMLGKLIKETNMTSLESVKKAMEKCIPPKKAHLVELNMKAIQIGYDY